jgi:hypothetical protein
MLSHVIAHPSLPRRGLAAIIALVVLAGSVACTPGSSTAAPDGGPPTDAPAQPTGGAVTDPAKLCDLLGPGDFDAAGITGAGDATVNSDGPGSAFCVFAGASAATGGIEFDAFIDDDPASVYATITAEDAAELSAIDVEGADVAEGWDGTDGTADQFGRIIVRAGKLVFTIGVPGGDGVAAQLASLADLVVGRAAALTG